MSRSRHGGRRYSRRPHRERGRLPWPQRGKLSLDHAIITAIPSRITLQHLDAHLKRCSHRGRRARLWKSARRRSTAAGYHTQRVWSISFAAHLTAEPGAIKGESARTGARPRTSPRASHRRGQQKLIARSSSARNAAKDVIRDRLHIEKAGPGYMHYPVDRDINYFAQLTAERSIVAVNGQPCFPHSELTARSRERGARLPGLRLCRAVRPLALRARAQPPRRSGERGTVDRDNASVAGPGKDHRNEHCRWRGGGGRAADSAAETARDAQPWTCSA